MALTISQIKEFVAALEYANSELADEIYSKLNQDFYALIESFFTSTPSTSVLNTTTLRDTETRRALLDLTSKTKISEDTIEAIALSLEQYGNSEIKKLISDEYHISFPQTKLSGDFISVVMRLLKGKKISGRIGEAHQTLKTRYLETGPLEKESLKHSNNHEAPLVENQRSAQPPEKLTIEQLQEVVKALANQNYVAKNSENFFKLRSLISSFFNPKLSREILTSQDLEKHKEELKKQNVNETAINNLITSLQKYPDGAEIKEIISMHYKILLEENINFKDGNLIIDLITGKEISHRGDQMELEVLKKKYKDKQSTPQPELTKESATNENSNLSNSNASLTLASPLEKSAEASAVISTQATSEDVNQEPINPVNNNAKTKPQEAQLTYEQIEETFGILEQFKSDDDNCFNIYWHFSNLVLSFFNQKREPLLTADELKNNRRIFNALEVNSKTLDKLILSLEADPTGSEIKKLIFDKFKIAPDVKVDFKNAQELVVVILILLQEKYTTLSDPQKLYDKIEKLTNPPEVSVVATAQVASEDSNPSNISVQNSTIDPITLQEPTIPENNNNTAKNHKETQLILEQASATGPLPEPAPQIADPLSKTQRQKDFLSALKTEVMQLDRWSKQARFSLFGKPPTHIGRLQNLVQPIHLEKCSDNEIEKLTIQAIKILISAKDYDSLFRKDVTQSTYNVLLDGGLKALSMDENNFRSKYRENDTNIAIAEARSLR